MPVIRQPSFKWEAAVFNPAPFMMTGAPKPLYASELGVLYVEDCIAVLPLIRDEVVDTVFADPFSSLESNRDQRVPAHSRPASPELL